MFKDNPFRSPQPSLPPAAPRAVPPPTMDRRGLFRASLVAGASLGLSGCLERIGSERGDLDSVSGKDQDSLPMAQGAAPMEKPLDWKAWGKQSFVGVENETIPSFNADFTRLSEKAIRLDVDQSIRHGFVSTLCASELVGTNLREAAELVSIAASQGRGKIHVSTTILFDDFDRGFAMMEHADRAGCTHVLLGYPPSFNPSSDREIFEITRQLVQTANVGVMLYPKFDFTKVRPEAIVDMLADVIALPNVFAAKIYDGPFFEQCQQRFGKTITIASPNPISLPDNVKKYGQQWIGAGPYEVFQSPDRPYFVQLVKLLVEGRPEAMGIFQTLLPVMQSFLERHGPQAMLGMYNWPEHKFYQWCTGGNGGYPRQPAMRITKATMDKVRADFASIGITVRDSDDLFFRGRS